MIFSEMTKSLQFRSQEMAFASSWSRNKPVTGYSEGRNGIQLQKDLQKTEWKVLAENFWVEKFWAEWIY